MASVPPTRKVVFLSAGAGIGGMERIICGLARGFSARSWDVQPVFPEAAKRLPLLEWCRDQGVIAEVHPAVLERHIYRSHRELLRLRDFVRQTQADVVNIHYGDNFISLKDVLAIRLAGGRKCVVSVHHPTPWDKSNAKTRKLTRLAGYLSDSVIAVSRATHQVLLEAGLPRKKTYLVPYGLPVPAATPSRSEARARLRIPPGRFVVGVLAQLVQHKGLPDLIESVARVPDLRSEMVLVIAGDGPERAHLECMAADRLKSRIVFTGRIPDVNDFYAGCDLFVLPSYLEGFGLVYMEAAFHRVPSIGTNAGGVPDAVVDGETGVLIDPGDVSALAAAIQKLRNDAGLRRRLGEAARTRAIAQFTEKTMVEGYLKVFER